MLLYGKRLGPALILTPTSLKNVPIPSIDEETKESIGSIVRMLCSTTQNTSEKLQRIDTLLYEALDISPTERQSIKEYIADVNKTTSKLFWEQSLG